MNSRIFQLQRNLGFFVPLPYILSPSWKEISLSQISPFLHKYLLLSNLSMQLGSKIQQPKQRTNKENHNNNHSFPDRLFQRFKFNRVLRILLCRNGSLCLLLPTEERKKSAHKLKGEGSSFFLFLQQRQVTIMKPSRLANNKEPTFHARTIFLWSSTSPGFPQSFVANRGTLAGSGKLS